MCNDEVLLKQTYSDINTVICGNNVGYCYSTETEKGSVDIQVFVFSDGFTGLNVLYLPRRLGSRPIRAAFQGGLKLSRGGGGPAPVVLTPAQNCRSSEVSFCLIYLSLKINSRAALISFGIIAIKSLCF